MSLRTRIVWGGLLAAFTGTFAVLAPLRPATTIESGRAVSPLPMLSVAAPSGVESVLATPTPLTHERWDAIVIHHSASPADSPASLDRRHREMGLNGLGYHFVIGNGRRMGDGEIHVGSRWLEQLPGAHVAGDAGLDLNQRSIGICLVGDGDRRTFSESQYRRLMDLVTLLRREFGIPASAVQLHREVATTSSPGRFFPAARFAEQLAAMP